MNDQEVLVTGGSRGLGLVIVKSLVERGWNVVCIQRTISQELKQLQQAHHDRVRVFEFDLANTEELDHQFRSEWFSADRPVFGLVNNAAVAYDDLLTNLDLGRLDAMWKINVTASLMLTKMVVRRMLLHGTQGSLVHVSSIAAHSGFKGLSMYGATKGAIESFSRGVAREWGSRGIRSNCVVPGFMETDMSQGLSDELKQKIYRHSALQKPTDPVSVAATVVFLLSGESHSITGQNFLVDSGKSC
jgi:3-oxoacyl-[acyl-carrier protein] reductase